MAIDRGDTTTTFSLGLLTRDKLYRIGDFFQLNFYVNIAEYNYSYSKYGRSTVKTRTTHFLVHTQVNKINK